ncbi:hypothetical protein BJ508DRAFT_154435 [Ascobolus immersus RN42]|uniref:Uncharacterized protein n=1 Tax=Ascobolus immersus RN42 TaxID=1160509 RepID=A0A3N4HXL2_ASCIM|nr:hypothetical protein BJ508DRAFT_154435 [Ascobolus immersus RN42]
MHLAKKALRLVRLSSERKTRISTNNRTSQPTLREVDLFDNCRRKSPDEERRPIITSLPRCVGLAPLAHPNYWLKQNGRNAEVVVASQLRIVAGPNNQSNLTKLRILSSLLPFLPYLNNDHTRFIPNPSLSIANSQTTNSRIFNGRSAQTQHLPPANCTLNSAIDGTN